MKFTESQKEEILQAMLQKASDLKLSDNAASMQIGISNGYYSSIKNRNWEKIADKTWARVSAWVNLRMGWQLAQTKSYTRINGVCQHAMRDSIALAICDEPGYGKSFCLKHFSEKNSNVYYIECQEYYTKSVFIQELGKALGIKLSGSISEQVEMVIEILTVRKGALLIIDEADKLKDGCLNIWKTLYNRLEGLCGFVICGAPNLKKKLLSGAKKDKQCYKEIISRIGGEFIPLVAASKEDKMAICRANGITEDIIPEVLSLSPSGDLRILKRVIDKIKVQYNL